MTRHLDCCSAAGLIAIQRTRVLPVMLSAVLPALLSMVSLIVALAVLLVSTPTRAEVFRCIGADGKVSFQDNICRAGEVEHKVDMTDKRRHPQLKATAPSKSLPPGAGARVSRENLLGLWCAFAQSKDGKNRYQDDDPAMWHFKDYRQLSYSLKSAYNAEQEVFSDYRLDGVKILSQNKLIGDWEVTEFNGSTLTLFNGIGYQYLRKGPCF
ncbi:DUF4124 domain-containing protein [Shewanella sp. JM162201]|uniref:DUF4124 domain-containing protein n=1 Tax=Shewanella jiangmenensis TaxID=2837387 RepID=A0ABS5V0D3_9GAMM|nr:DUF4124 domain-containing protein [Shewanella jiangmenensis]MBT1443928.1 DUF4124 domain-containing protein [Shewanella jiangmenensis]